MYVFHGWTSSQNTVKSSSLQGKEKNDVNQRREGMLEMVGRECSYVAKTS